MRYSFYDQLGKVKVDPKRVLPEDINGPVHEYLTRRGLVLASKTLKEYEKHVRYGTIYAAVKNKPESKIKIHVDCGMVGEIVEMHVTELANEICQEEYTIKNENLDKRNPNKGAKK
jgi:hypothetical protein